MIYINVPKPGAQTYLDLNPQGKEQYDQPDIIYDSTTTFYDGVNMGAYINIPKPVFIVQSIKKGMATGLLMPLTYSVNITNSGDYTYVPKPN